MTSYLPIWPEFLRLFEAALDPTHGNVLVLGKLMPHLVSAFTTLMHSINSGVNRRGEAAPMGDPMEDPLEFMTCIFDRLEEEVFPTLKDVSLIC
jgi:hypothetical protein